MPSLNWFLGNGVVLDVTVQGGCSVLDEFHLVEPTPLTNWQDAAWMRGRRLERSALQQAARGDAIHERRKSTTKFTFALGWRADYILHSKVMAKATRGGEKIVQEGSLRNSSMVSWETYTFSHEATEGQTPRVPSGILLVAFCVICPFWAFYLYFSSCAL